MTKNHVEGKILYKNGDSSPLVASPDKVEEIRESRNPGVDHIWFESDGPGFDWDEASSCWQRRLF